MHDVTAQLGHIDILVNNAGTVAFFCSADSDYITDQALNVDGGFEMDWRGPYCALRSSYGADRLLWR